VNIAARVLGLADAGEVLFTEAIWLSMNRNEIEADDGGYQELKGVPEPVRVFRVKPGSDLSQRPYSGKALQRAGKLGQGDLWKRRSKTSSRGARPLRRPSGEGGEGGRRVKVK